MARRFGPQGDETVQDGEREDLPWLGPASEDFEDDDGERMIPRSWLLGGLAAFLLVLASVVGFIYFRMAKPSGDNGGEVQTAANVDPETLPLIEADKSPIREQPADRGGMTPANADLQVMDVASGEQPSEPTVLAQGSETPVKRPALPPVQEPVIPPAAKPTPPPEVAQAPASAPKPVPPKPAPKPVEVAKAPAPTPAPAPATKGGIYLQLGAFSTQARADAAWGQVQGKFASLGGLGRNVQQAGPTKFRLRAGPVSSADEAKRICGELKAQGQACIPAS
jgi:cell division protein FtsN